jgi:hypothetical protein
VLAMFSQGENTKMYDCKKLDMDFEDENMPLAVKITNHPFRFREMEFYKLLRIKEI